MVDSRYLAYDLNLYPKCCAKILGAELIRCSVPPSIKEDPMVFLVRESVFDYVIKQIGLQVPSDIFNLMTPATDLLLVDDPSNEPPSRFFIFEVASNTSFYYLEGDILYKNGSGFVACRPSSDSIEFTQNSEVY